MQIFFGSNLKTLLNRGVACVTAGAKVLDCKLICNYFFVLVDYQ
jgi:hypothetical protein